MKTVVQDVVLALGAVWLLVAGGCSFVETDQGAARGVRPVRIVESSVVHSEPVVSALEKATGRTLNPQVVDKGAQVAGAVAAVSKTGAGVATALGAPGIGGLLGAVAGLAGALATFFQRRKAQALAKVASRAADQVKGGGKVLVEESLKLGVADDIRRAYNERKVADG